MATGQVFAGRWTKNCYYCKFLCMHEYNKVIQSNDTLKSYTMWKYWQKYLQWFYQTMHLVEKQQNLTLKKLILYNLRGGFHAYCYNKLILYDAPKHCDQKGSDKNLHNVCQS